MKFIQTAERISLKEPSDNYIFQRSLRAYIEASKIISGNVLEVGTGSGYGIEIIAPHTSQFTTIDKYSIDAIADRSTINRDSIAFIQMTVPPLRGIPDNSFDFVISFQVIEHIKKDNYFVKEVHRVLKKGGKFIVTTPNKKMSLTRNPWHVREYTLDELENLLKVDFQAVEKLGIFGSEQVMACYTENKKAVQHITRFDLFNLQYRLPRQLLQLPYDILNRINRKRLLKNNRALVSGIGIDDYHINKAAEKCFDWFYIAEKNDMPDGVQRE